MVLVLISSTTSFAQSTQTSSTIPGGEVTGKVLGGSGKGIMLQKGISGKG